MPTFASHCNPQTISDKHEESGLIDLVLRKIDTTANFYMAIVPMDEPAGLHQPASLRGVILPSHGPLPLRVDTS
jgi:hypothetical protein